MKFATLAEAVDYYRKLAIENPDNPVILNTLGDLLVKSGDKKRALEEYRRAIKLLEQSANYQNALAISKKILRYIGKDIETIIRISRLLTKTGKYEEAIKYMSILNPDELSDTQRDEVVGLANFLMSAADDPEVKLRLTKIYNILQEKIGDRDKGEGEFVLGFEEEINSDDVPPLLAETQVKVGDEVIIDLSIPGEAEEFNSELSDPDFMKTVLRKLSEGIYRPYIVNYESLNALVKGGFFREALWLLHNSDIRENNEFDWKKFLIKCLVETESKEEIESTIEDFEEVGLDSEILYYVGRACELIGEREKALKYYLKVKTYFGNFGDVDKRIKNLRRGKL